MTLPNTYVAGVALSCLAHAIPSQSFASAAVETSSTLILLSNYYTVKLNKELGSLH